MNGEVMDETIETPVSENASIIPELVHTSGNQEVDEGQRENLPDTKEEGASDQECGITYELDQKNQSEEECTSIKTAQCNKKREKSPLQGICDEDVRNTKVTSHDQELDGLPEGVSGAPAITTNGLEKKESNINSINVKKFSEPEYELENSNTFPEKINNNSKDSMLSTADTQDEIDTTENGDQIFINHIIHKEPSEKEDNKKEIADIEVESEDSLEEMLGSDLDPQTEETFSIVSGSEYDEVSQGSVLDKNTDVNTDVIILENDVPGNRNGNTSSPEVYEIHSENEDDDDCVVTVAEVHTPSTASKAPTDKKELRRSSRTIKRRKYTYDFEENQDDESDVEEVSLNERRKPRPIMINDTKSLVEIAAKQAARSTSASRREPQLVLIGARPTTKAATSTPKSCSSSMNASLYQSIVARGTTVTPVPNKASMATQACQTPPPTPPPAILPSLTDDMFVVEAPSFIVPYVYEKPSIEPFKEFVEKLGKDLDEQKAKTNKELLEKKKIDKERRHKERQERRERGEEVEDSDEETKKRKMEEKEKRRRQREEDDESWDGSDSTDSEDFKITDEDGTTIVINNSLEEVKDDVDMFPASTSTSKSDNYFDSSLGKFFMNIGMSLVQEYVQADLLKQQQRKLQREKKTGQSTKEREVSICLLKKNLELSKENNEPYACPQLKCEHCSFKTESALVLAQHLETPHMKNNMYKCNFCPFEIRSPPDILFHLEAEHNIRGKLERAPACHQCVNCPFEDNGKGKLARHIISCAKKFKPEHNLSPPLEWEPPAKIPKVAKARNSMMGAPYPNAFGRQQFSSGFSRVSVVSGPLPPAFRPRGRFPAPPTPRLVQAGGSIVRGSSMLRQNAAITNYPVINAKKSQHPSISITPLPRQPAAPPVLHLPAGQNTKGGNFVICEICDGYIKDLDQLRNHMQWIHKVKIHPKMIYNRPPLNCQKCQFRFFTDQGLERHLLGSHGLVTSSMQEAANKSKDAGRCPVCGKVYQWKLLNHVARDHNLTLKPAHLSYKCTVCSATFGMYKLFENHVYSAHSVVAKRVMDKNVPTNKTNNKSNAPKGLKINDEITITAQPVKASPSANKNK